MATAPHQMRTGLEPVRAGFSFQRITKLLDALFDHYLLHGNEIEIRTDDPKGSIVLVVILHEILDVPGCDILLNFHRARKQCAQDCNQEGSS